MNASKPSKHPPDKVEKYIKKTFRWEHCFLYRHTLARVWMNRARLPILLVVSETGKMKSSLSPFAPLEFGLARRVGQSHLPSACSFHTQAESGSYLWDSFRVPRRRPFIYLNRHTSSVQLRVYRVTQLRIDGVHCRESDGTEPVVLKVVPVTGAALAGCHVYVCCHPIYSGRETCGRTSRGHTVLLRLPSARCLPSFLSLETFCRAFPSSTEKSNSV